MQVYIATYTTGHGDSFAAMNKEDVYKHLEDEHGGKELHSFTASNQTCCIRWVDNCDCEFMVEVVTGELVGMDDKPIHLSELTDSFDIWVATRANIAYWAGVVDNGYEEGSHEHIVYAGEIKLCVNKYAGKVK